MVVRKSESTKKQTKTPVKTNVAKTFVKDTAAPDVAQVKAAPAKFLRRKEMVERVVASSGLKPNVVKTALDAVLLELGNALSAGEDLNLQPLGKVTVNRKKQVKDREIIICKIRRKLAGSEKIATLDTAAE